MRNLRTDIFHYRLSWSFILLILSICLFGDILMPSGITPDQKIVGEWVEENGVKTWVSPPYPPSSRFWLGTDHRGYDLLSLLLHGAKYTIGFAFLVAMLRLVLALPIGLFAGLTNRGRSMLTTFQVITSSIPALIIIYPPMYGLSKILPPDQSASFLLMMLVLVGIWGIAHQYAERAATLKGKLYIEASKTLGGGSLHIMKHHLFPNLRPEIVYSFLTEFSQVMFLIGQLAIAQVFIGGGEPITLDTIGSHTVRITLPQSGEWGGMLAYGIHGIRDYPWIIGFTSLFLAGVILSVSYFATQVQKRMANSIVVRQPSERITYLRRSVPFVAAMLITIMSFYLFTHPYVPNSKPVNGHSQPSGQPASPPDEVSQEMKIKMVEQANQFFELLSQNKWDYASFMISSINTDSTSKEAPEPYKTWIEQLVNKQSQYTGVGSVSKIIRSHDKYEFDHCLVEIKVRTNQGQEVSWYLMMGLDARIISGTIGLPE
jgi:peptide/nickel transport system permease protein